MGRWDDGCASPAAGRLDRVGPDPVAPALRTAKEEVRKAGCVVRF
jgi:hypothetical protein